MGGEKQGILYDTEKMGYMFGVSVLEGYLGRGETLDEGLRLGIFRGKE